MAGSTGDPGEKKPEGFTTQLFILAATVAATIASGVGNIIASDFQHRQPLMFALLGALAGVLACLAGCMTVAWFFRRRRWAAWLLPGSRLAMACTVAALGLSAGGTLGSLDLVPPCPVPVELPVLSSAESLPGVLRAIN